MELPAHGADDALHGVVARLGLEAWTDQLAREQLSLERLARASPADLRTTLGMPLGLAIDLVHAASQSRAGDASGVASAPRKAGEAGSLAGSFVGGSFAGGARGVEPGHAGRVRRGHTCACGDWPLLSLVKHAWRLRGKFTFLDALLMFKDHTTLWKECLVFAADDETLRASIIASCGMWTTCMSLWLGVITSFLGIEEPQVNPRILLLFEALVSVASMVMLLAVILWCVILLCASATHASNIRSFVLSAMAPLQVAEYFLLAAVYLSILVFLLLAQLRIWNLAEDVGVGLCSNAAYAVAAVQLASVFLIAVSIYVLTNVTCLGGLMGPAPGPTLGADAGAVGGPQQVLREASDRVWRQVSRVRSRTDALSLYWHGAAGGKGVSGMDGGAGAVCCTADLVSWCAAPAQIGVQKSEI